MKRPLDSVKVAKDAGLQYVTAGELGLRRRKNRRGFVYEDSRGARVKSIRSRIVSAPLASSTTLLTCLTSMTASTMDGCDV